MKLFKSILYTLAVILFSALLIAYAYDLSNNIEIAKSSTRQSTQNLLISAAKSLGIIGSWIIGIIAIGIRLLVTFHTYKNEKSK